VSHLMDLVEAMLIMDGLNEVSNEDERVQKIVAKVEENDPWDDEVVVDVYDQIVHL